MFFQEVGFHTVSLFLSILCFDTCRIFSIDATLEVFSMGRMVNDAAEKDPENNCKMSVVVVDHQPHLCLFATRDITTGEELRYDYNDVNLPWRKVRVLNVAFLSRSMTPFLIILGN